MFAKFVSRIPGNRELAAQYDVFRTEISLYENLGDAIPLIIPKMYFGAAREESDVAVLLLEEINAVSKAGLPAEEWTLNEFEARLALSELSKLHAMWWEDGALDGFKWLGTMDDEWRRSLYRTYHEAWKCLRDAMEPVLTPTEIRAFNELSIYLPTLTSEINKIPVTLCHGDYHLENLMWDKAGEPDAIWAVDWQRTTKGPGVIDIASLLGASVTRADLHLVRQEYLPEYHKALLDHDVVDYDFDQLLSDYRYALLYSLTRVIVALANLDLAREDSVEIARHAVGNFAAAAVDAGSADLIS